MLKSIRILSLPSIPSSIASTVSAFMTTRGYSTPPFSSSASTSSASSSSKKGHKPRSKTTVITLRNLYEKKEPISVVTAHDYPSGLMADKAGIDMVLVGDSLAMVALGYTSTVSITVDEMLHHCRAVARGATHPFLIGDMPFGSYQSGAHDAVKNAIRFIKEGNMESVKLEGGVEMAETIKKIVDVGIPVMGHIGLTPQSSTALGGFRVQGKTVDQALGLMKDAKALEEAGCYAIVIEAVPEGVAEQITKSISIPTIGIGAGSSTSGQVLVQLDMLGIFDRFVPKFCKQYVSLEPQIRSALEEYNADVKERKFPSSEHCYPMPAEELEKFLKAIKS